jgi:hypothetical protein
MTNRTPAVCEAAGECTKDKASAMLRESIRQEARRPIRSKQFLRPGRAPFTGQVTLFQVEHN